MMRISRIRRYPIKGLAGEDLKTRGWHGFRPPSMATAASRSIGTEYRPREGRPDQVGGLAGIESALSQHFEGETIGGNLYLEGVTAWQELGGS